jgi:glycosyltransferase involved in cell wall biosynthesis
MVPYMQSMPMLKALFAPYDIVQAYGVDPILPLLAGKSRYVGFEHGTLRDFVRGDNYMHRLTALGYRKAAHVFVTNGDCREHAEWLGIRHYSAMLHPIDVDQHEARDEPAIAALRRSYNAELLLFCPVRHDWDVKGTDVHLRALPHIRERLGKRVKLVLAPWGLQLEDSRRLIAELGCSDSVVWLDRALCRVALIRHMQAADVVLDQMALPHFGATAPQALAAGTPVVMSYRPDSTAWIVREPAPICVAFTPDEVADAVVQALDPAWLRDFKLRAKRWVHSHHHHHRLIADHLQVYRDLVENLDDDGSGSPKGTI